MGEKEREPHGSGVIRTPEPGVLVAVSAPDEGLVRAAELREGPFESGRCEGNAVALARAAQARGDQVELIFGFWFPKEGRGTHAWLTINGRHVDPTAKLLKEVASQVEYLERIRCSVEEQER